jgi:hypothetical protein
MYRLEPSANDELSQLASRLTPPQRSLLCILAVQAFQGQPEFLAIRSGYGDRLLWFV